MLNFGRLIFLFTPYRSFGNTCEYIYAALVFAQNAGLKLIIIQPKTFGILNVANPELSKLCHSSMAFLPVLQWVLEFLYTCFECIRIVLSRLFSDSRFGSLFTFPLSFCARTFAYASQHLDNPELVRWPKFVFPIFSNKTGESNVDEDLQKFIDAGPYIVFHARSKSETSRMSRHSDERILRKFIMQLCELGVRVLLLGEESWHDEISAHDRLFKSSSFRGDKAVSSLWAISQCEAAICTSSGPHCAALLFGKAVLAINCSQIIMEPHKVNDLTVIKAVFENGRQIDAEEYLKRLDEFQFVDDRDYGERLETRDNSCQEMLTAFRQFLDLNPNLKLDVDRDRLYSVTANVGLSGHINTFPRVRKAIINGELDWIYGTKRIDGSKFWRQRLEFNTANSSSFYRLSTISFPDGALSKRQNI